MGDRELDAYGRSECQFCAGRFDNLSKHPCLPKVKALEAWAKKAALKLFIIDGEMSGRDREIESLLKKAEGLGLTEEKK